MEENHVTGMKENHAAKRAMISQPITGRTEAEIAAAREKAVEVLFATGCDIVNAGRAGKRFKEGMDERGVVQIPLCYTAKVLENMSRCHIAYFCRGWQADRDCRIEHAAALAYGLEIIYEDESELTMDFGSAIRALKDGKKVARQGWNGKGQYLTLGDEFTYKDMSGKHDANHRTSGRAAIVFHGTIGEQVGWLASQSDMLSEDWMIVKQEEYHERKDFYKESEGRSRQVRQ